MDVSEKALLDLLQNNYLNFTRNEFYELSTECEGFLSAKNMAGLYTKSALLVAGLNFVKEQLWLNDKEDKRKNILTTYEDFITPLFKNELESLKFLKKLLIDQGASEIKQTLKIASEIESRVISLIIDRSNFEQKEFVTHSLEDMSLYFLHEENNQKDREQSLGHFGPRLYRTFDRLDEIFNLDYQLDLDMVVDHDAKERLYERAGIGVQSGYSTILLTLDYIDLEKDSKVVDLGSGYGRVGLVCSLLYPDVKFIGYEYVPHRVVVSNEASLALSLDENLEFLVQDLSLDSFSIPIADVYYLYDPFTKETYKYILDQIVEISKSRTVQVVTKGNASTWVREIAEKNSWGAIKEIDEGNLCIFKSS